MVGCLFSAAPATAAAPTQTNPPSSLLDDSLRSIQFDQKLDNKVSSDLVFRDESGRQIRLGDYFDSHPVILVLGYYECPMLCSLVLNGLVDCLYDLKPTAGTDFEIVDLSIDPAESPALAAAKKQTYLKRYGRHGAAEGWHFLTGEEQSIRQLADEVGFRYAYDPAIDQYAHPSGFVLLTPDGTVSHYFFGVDFSPDEVAAALREAEANEVGSPVEQLILLCFHYAPLRGKYGNLILTVLRLSGIATLLAMGVVAVVIARRRHRARAAGEATMDFAEGRGNPSTHEEGAP